MLFNSTRESNSARAAKATHWFDKLARVPLPSISLTLWIAAILRIASVVALHNFRHPQTWEFGPLARNLAAGFGFTEILKNGRHAPSIYMPPAYSYFLAAFYRMAGEKQGTYIAIEILQALCGVLLVYLVYRLGQLLAGERAGLGAAFIVAVYPTQIYICNEFHGVNIYIVLGVAVVYFLTKYSCFHDSLLNLVLAGICMGPLMLFRGEAPALALLFAVILLFRGGAKSVLPTLAFLAISFGCVAPWVVRNYVTFHRFILVCASGGTNLWIGHNPHAGASQHSQADYPYPPEIVSAFDASEAPFHSPQRDDLFRNAALTYIKNHPKREIELAAMKLSIFMVFDPAHKKGRNPIYWVPSLLLTTLAIFACFRGGRVPINRNLFLLTSIAFTILVSMVVFALPRYKIAIDPFIVIVAAQLFTESKSSEPTKILGDKSINALTNA